MAVSYALALEGRLRQTLDQREAQLVRLVRELYELATAERMEGRLVVVS